ncbi:hypothetical protein PRIC2_002225 [Phytophthora ramorum]|uniref:uncharacterized protein n=1 Tax=Phytophthora ramorum TaxID=164328 RepID=UPI00309D7FDC|nr:hypothetical protein KRP23_1026 [Phytophthora ramorum]
MMRPIFSPGSAIQRAKPLFELSDAGHDIDRKRVKKKIVPLAPIERVIPFDSESILEAVDCSGNSGSQVVLTILGVELADFQDLVAEPTAASTDGERLEQGTRQKHRRGGDGTMNAIDTSSRSLISLGPLKASSHGSDIANRSSRTRSAPRVTQRYQLRHPDELIAEASERRRIIDEILNLDNQRRGKEEELTKICKREKEAGSHRSEPQGLKAARTYSTSKKPVACNPPFTNELLQHI